MRQCSQTKYSIVKYYIINIIRIARLLSACANEARTVIYKRYAAQETKRCSKLVINWRGSESSSAAGAVLEGATPLAQVPGPQWEVTFIYKLYINSALPIYLLWTTEIYHLNYKEIELLLSCYSITSFRLHRPHRKCPFPWWDRGPM